MPVKELIKKLKFKRNWLINAAAGGLVAFLALPAFFDTEEPAPLTARAHYEGLDAKGVPLSFTPDEEGEEAALPIVAAQKARRKAQSGNAFFKYMDKVGNFYRKGFEVAVGINPAGRAPEEDFYMEARADYERSAPLAPAEYNSNVQQNLKAAASGVRQQPAGLTPVRGLYEVSLTDGDKYEAKQVYKGVIGKVNRATPGLAPQKPARKYAIMQETFVLAGNNMAGAGIYAAPFGGLSGFGANIGGSSSQSGIAGAADTASGSAFGRYGGFGGVSSRVPDAPQEDESMQANFETAAAGFERRVRAIASKGGSSGDKPDSAAAAVRDSIRQNVASSQGGGTDGGAGNNQPSQPSGGQPDNNTPQPNPPTPAAAHEPIVFNANGENFTKEVSKSNCETEDASSGQESLPTAQLPESGGEDKKEDKKNVPPNGGTLPKISSDKIKGRKYQVLVVLGAKDKSGNEYMLPTKDSPLIKTMVSLGFPEDIIIVARVPSLQSPETGASLLVCTFEDVPAVGELSKQDYDSFQSRSDIIEINVDPNAVNKNNVNFAVSIENDEKIENDQAAWKEVINKINAKLDE